MLIDLNEKRTFSQDFCDVFIQKERGAREKFILLIDVDQNDGIKESILQNDFEIISHWKTAHIGPGPHGDA